MGPAEVHNTHAQRKQNHDNKDNTVEHSNAHRRTHKGTKRSTPAHTQLPTHNDPRAKNKSVTCNNQKTRTHVDGHGHDSRNTEKRALICKHKYSHLYPCCRRQRGYVLLYLCLHLTRASGRTPRIFWIALSARSSCVRVGTGGGGTVGGSVGTWVPPSGPCWFRRWFRRWFHCTWVPPSGFCWRLCWLCRLLCRRNWLRWW